ncbi:MAG: ABC transporter substrate-binding protein [Candidatus Bipolaricaulota bacterium]|nr:ABC transporter substrate-binding protein [Candidatus Bipolaricaulota bacterium]MDW8328977.1 ABC transporter substrate-binding protein [Candidatus Bipolaricaulota bacterium]
MRKLLILGATLSLLLLAACGGPKQDQTATKPESPAQPPITAEKPPTPETPTPPTTTQPPTPPPTPPEQKPSEKAETVTVVPGEQPPEAVAPTTTEIKNPDTLIVANLGDADTLDPVHAYDTASGEVIFNIYENLIAYDGSRTDRLVPLLASAVPSLENGLIRTESDGTTYITFPIRTDVNFHDGSPLTPEDVAYSFRRLMIHSHADSPAWILLEDLLEVHDLKELSEKVGDERACEMVKEAVTVKDQHVVFKLPKPSATFFARIAQSASWAAIQSKKFVIANGGWDEDCTHWKTYYSVEKEKLPLHNRALGTGPFKLERWTPGEEIVLVRNESYWRAPAPLSRVVIKIVPEFGTRKLMLERGDADIIWVPRQFVPQMEGTPGVRTVKNLPTISNEAAFFTYEIAVEGNPNIGSGKLDGNGIPPDFFTDIDVRKAFNYSFDWEVYTQQVYLGEAQQSYGPIPQSLGAFVNREGPRYSYDPQKAEEHFKRAWGGQLWERGFKMTLVYNEGNDIRKQAVQIFKDNIEALNPKFKIEVRGEPWPTFLDNYRSKRLPMFIIGWLADFPDPHNFALPFMHSQGTYAQKQSLNKIANYDDLILQAARELDPTKRQQLYYQLQQRAYEDAIDIFLVDAVGRSWQRTWVDGWMYNPMWPGQNFYLLSKKANADVHPELLRELPQVVIEAW